MSDLREFYLENGYAVVPGVFAGDQLAGLTRDFDRIVDQMIRSGEDLNAKWAGADAISGADSVVLHTHNVQHYSAAWMAAFMSAEFLAPVRELLGDDVVLHHSKLFQKPPENGAAFPMHQDWGYFPTAQDSMLAAVIHVSDATDEMGCLCVYPGSHKQGRIEASESMGGMERYPLSGATPLEAKPGDVVFFNYLTVHGSKPNTSDRTRKTVLIQLHDGKDLPDDNGHPYERIVVSGWNPYASREKSNRMKG